MSTTTCGTRGPGSSATTTGASTATTAITSSVSTVACTFTARTLPIVSIVPEPAESRQWRTCALWTDPRCADDGGPMQGFTFDQPAARIVFGAGAARTTLADEVGRLGVTRVLVIALHPRRAAGRGDHRAARRQGGRVVHRRARACPAAHGRGRPRRGEGGRPASSVPSA